MKKLLTFLSSLLIFTGLKAQVTPTVKKETQLPVAGQATDSVKAVDKNAVLKQTTGIIKQQKDIKDIKITQDHKVVKDHKVTVTPAMKETPAVKKTDIIIKK